MKYVLNQYPAKVITNEDLIMANTGTPGAVFYGIDGILSNNLFRISFNRGLFNKRYLFYCFSSPLFHSFLRQNFKQTAQPHLGHKVFARFQIPIAPFLEQKRIAAKLDGLLAEVDACKARLDKVPEIIKRFRQSVLADAVAGKLTEDWREKNDEIGGIQLDRIIEQIFQRRLNQQTSSSSKNKIKEIYHQNSIVPSKNLPEQWRYVELKKIAESFAYGSSKKSAKEGEVPVLRMGNIQNSIIDWTDLVFTSDKEEIEKYKLAPGNVLFNRTNSP
ncbi:MAG: hypothetical protein GY699_02315, partial [Desulfobacteraceae bacterium]|nr:hypothetical protein [Desulfobacteraceae bacterium]